MALSNHKQHVVFARRWAGFVSSIWLMVFSGTYGFSNYSTALKDVLGLNQKQLNRLSVAKDLGDSCGILAGILSNHLPAWGLLCIGACVGFVGYGIQLLVVSRIINPLPYWIMFIAAMVAGNTVSWMNTSVFTVSVRNFPRNRGPVVGLFKAYMGLSAAIFSNFCDTFFASSSSMYMLMLVTIPPTFCLITAIFFRPVPPAETEEEEKAEQQSLLVFNIIASVLAIYIIVQDFVPDLKQGRARPVALGLLFAILAAPACVPLVLFFKMKQRERLEATSKVEVGGEGEEEEEEEDAMKSIGKREAKGLNGAKIRSDSAGNNDNNPGGTVPEKDGLGEPLLVEDYDTASFEKQSKAGRWCRSGSSSSSKELGDDRTTLSLFKTWHFYVLYFALFCGAGSGMAFSNNLGQVGQSFGFRTVTLFTSLFSLGNFFGRIASGNISEHFLSLSEGVRVVRVPNIPNPYRDQPYFNQRFKFSLNKIYAWTLVDYERIIMLDVDNVFTRKTDELFLCGQFCAVFIDPCIFHTGLFVLEPSNKVYRDMYKYLSTGEENIDGADQGFLTSYFSELLDKPLFHPPPSNNKTRLTGYYRLPLGYQMDASYYYIRLKWCVPCGANSIITFPSVSWLKPWYWWSWPVLPLGLSWHDQRKATIGYTDESCILLAESFLYYAALVLASAAWLGLFPSLNKHGDQIYKSCVPKNLWIKHEAMCTVFFRRVLPPLCVFVRLLFPMWMIPSTSHPIAGWGVFLLGSFSLLITFMTMLTLESSPTMTPWVLIFISLLVMAFPFYENGIIRMLAIFGFGAFSTPFLWWSLKSISTRQRFSNLERKSGKSSLGLKLTSQAVLRNCED